MYSFLKNSLKFGAIFGAVCLQAKTATLVSPYCPETWPGGIEGIKSKHSIICICPEHANLTAVNLDYNNTDKIIFFDLNLNNSLPQNLVKKNVLFQVEARYYDEKYFSNFDRIYTWDDKLIDNKRFFKFYYPYQCEMKEDVPLFHDKKFMCLVVSNWSPQHRLIALDYFSKKPELIDIYGSNLPFIYQNSEMYKGPIPGHHSCDMKYEIMKNYKYCLCSENTLNTYGYITEKIFACFRSGCVPIYWGATNITKYVPSDCFIDFRNFATYDELITFLDTISEDEYNRYLDNIRKFLVSEAAMKFSVDYFESILNDAIEYE